MRAGKLIPILAVVVSVGCSAAEEAPAAFQPASPACEGASRHAVSAILRGEPLMDELTSAVQRYVDASGSHRRALANELVQSLNDVAGVLRGVSAQSHVSRESCESSTRLYEVLGLLDQSMKQAAGRLETCARYLGPRAKEIAADAGFDDGDLEGAMLMCVRGALKDVVADMNTLVENAREGLAAS